MKPFQTVTRRRPSLRSLVDLLTFLAAVAVVLFATFAAHAQTPLRGVSDGPGVRKPGVACDGEARVAPMARSG